MSPLRAPSIPTAGASHAILDKLRAWEKQNIPPRREQLQQKAAAKSRERFQRYLVAHGLATQDHP